MIIQNLWQMITRNILFSQKLYGQFMINSYFRNAIGYSSWAKTSCSAVVHPCVTLLHSNVCSIENVMHHWPLKILPWLDACVLCFWSSNCPAQEYSIHTKVVEHHTQSTPFSGLIGQRSISQLLLFNGTVICLDSLYLPGVLIFPLIVSSCTVPTWYLQRLTVQQTMLKCGIWTGLPFIWIWHVVVWVTGKLNEKSGSREISVGLVWSRVPVRLLFCFISCQLSAEDDWKPQRSFRDDYFISIKYEKQ
jgi:hypothetical protein